MSQLPGDAVYDLTRAMDVTVSPDGTRAAVHVLEHDRGADRQRSSVLVTPTDGGREPYRLTRQSDPITMRWSPDGSKLGVVMARERDTALRVADDGSADDGSADDEDPRPQLWVYDLARGGDPRQVTELDEGVQAFDWGPAGERVVVAARDPTPAAAESLQRRRDGGPIETERLQHKFEGAGWLDTVTTYLFVVDVETRERHRLDGAHGSGLVTQAGGLMPAWHPRNDRIAFVSNHSERSDDSYESDLSIVDADTGETERLTDDGRAVADPTWSPDGTRVAVTASDPTNWYAPPEVRVVDGDTGEHRTLNGGLDRHLAWFAHLVWLDSDSLLTAIGDGGWSRFVRLSADGGYERVYDRQPRNVSLVGFDAGGETVVFIRQQPQTGIDVFAMSVAGLSAAVGPRRLTELNPGLVADYDHPEIERITFEGADGDTVEGVVFCPPSFDPEAPDGDRPMLVSIHGGPRRYDEPQFDLDTAFWTSRGYLVFKPNYHGSVSYGGSFSERLAASWNDVEVTDVLAGTDAVVERGWADPDRLFVTGFSYGARATTYVLAASDRFAAGVAEHGSYDLRSTFGTGDSHRGFETEFGRPWERPAAYDEASAITDVDEIDTPLLLTAGGDDCRTPSTQSEQLHVSLRKRGVPSKLVVYPDTGHVHPYIADPDRATHRFETISAWLERFDPAVGGG